MTRPPLWAGLYTLCSWEHSANLDEGLSNEGKVTRGWAAKGMAWAWSSLGGLLLSWGWIQIVLMVSIRSDHKPVMHRASWAVLEATGEVLQKGRLGWTESRTTEWELGCYAIWGIKGVYAICNFRHQGLGTGRDKRVEGLFLSVERADGWGWGQKVAFAWGKVWKPVPKLLSATENPPFQ